MTQCMANFIANGVHGHKGKTLSEAEVQKIGKHMAQLEQQGLVISGPDAPEASQEASQEAAAEPAEEEVEAQPKGKKRR